MLASTTLIPHFTYLLLQGYAGIILHHNMFASFIEKERKGRMLEPTGSVRITFRKRKESKTKKEGWMGILRDVPVTSSRIGLNGYPTGCTCYLIHA